MNSPQQYDDLMQTWKSVYTENVNKEEETGLIFSSVEVATSRFFDFIASRWVVNNDIFFKRAVYEKLFYNNSISYSQT